MKDCIFCKIINKEIPAEVVYEDNNFIAFMDISPQAVGHVQVVPKAHYRWVWDLPAMPETAGDGRRACQNIGDYFKVVQKIALAQKQAFNTDVVWSHVEGKEVPHAHIWVYPDPSTPGDKTDFSENAKRIRKAI